MIKKSILIIIVILVTAIIMNNKKEKVKNQRTIMLATGGTGGHVFPAIALAEKLTKQKEKLPHKINPIFITDERAIKKFDFNGFTTKVIKSGSPRGGLFKKISQALKIIIGTIQSAYFIIKYKPDLIIGFGGYPSFPPILAGKILGKKILVHEQNATLGKVNELAFRYLKSPIALSFPMDTKETNNYQITIDNKKVFLTGLPIREDFFTKDKTDKNNKEEKDQRRINLLILGGSLGAEIFSTKLPHILGKLPESSKAQINIIQQCRKEFLDQTAKLYRDYGFENIELQPFIHDVAKKMDWSNIIISRAGASTVFEIMAKEKACILVPYPHATDNHQYKNAMFLERLGVAKIIAEKDLESTSTIADLLQDKNAIKRMQSKYKNNWAKENHYIPLDLLVNDILK